MISGRYSQALPMKATFNHPLKNFQAIYKVGHSLNAECYVFPKCKTTNSVLTNENFFHDTLCKCLSSTVLRITQITFKFDNRCFACKVLSAFEGIVMMYLASEWSNWNTSSSFEGKNKHSCLEMKGRRKPLFQDVENLLKVKQVFQLK